MPLYRRARSPYWWVRFSIGGRRVRESTGTKDREAAEQYETIARARAWRETRLGQATHAWKDAAARWETETATKRSADKDRQMLAWFAKNEKFADLDVAEITPDVIAAARAKLAEGLSENTVNKYLALVRAVLRKASSEWGWLAVAPRVPMFRIRPPDPRFLTHAQFGKLIRHLPTHTADMAKFAVLTGLRRSNITGLTWDRVDLKRGTAFVPASQAKGAKAIAVPLSAEAVRVLKRWKGKHETRVFVFQGEPVHQVATKAWRKAVKAAGLEEGFRFHDLRHTWASWQVQAETPLSVVQELGGWSSFEMVRRYAHLSPAHLKKYAGRVKLGTLAGHTRRHKEKRSA